MEKSTISPSSSVSAPGPHGRPELRYQAGGPVSDGAFYVRRGADEELPEALRRGEYCHVLAPRQSGKTSLLSRTQGLLLGEGLLCARIDLDQIGAEVTADQWYYALIEALAGQVGLPDASEFWRRDLMLPPLLRWRRYLEKEVLGRVHGPLVVFIDGIDVTLSLPFSRADFFAALRALHAARADDPVVQRLTFCLAGTMAPLELSDDPARATLSPGRLIGLSDFTGEEAYALGPGLAGLAASPGDPELWLDAILEWTAGHPALTQRLCQALVEEVDRTAPPGPADMRAQVEGLVRGLFPAAARLSDPILADIDRRFHKDNPRASGMLSVYRQILEQGRVQVAPQDEIQMSLRVAGLVGEQEDGEGRWLRLRNRVLGSVFDLSWVRHKESDRFLAARLLAWREHGKHEDYVLRGEELAEAVRWAQDREDVSAREREFLLAAEEVARAAERRAQEGEQVQQALLHARERARQGRRMLIGLLLLLGLIVLLLLTIAWLSRDARLSRSAEAAARGESARLLGELGTTRADLKAARESHEKTRAELAGVQATLEKLRGEMDGIKKDLGSKEARLKEVGGKVERLFKKRIQTKVPTRATNTGISNQVVDGVMISQGWPQVRACYPLGGPLPAVLKVDLTVLPEGQVSEADAEAAGEQKECIVKALRALRFPAFAGAHWVKIGYRYEDRRKR